MSGSTISRTACQRDAPSDLAASSSDESTPAKLARIAAIVKGRAMMTWPATKAIISGTGTIVRASSSEMPIRM